MSDQNRTEVLMKFFTGIEGLDDITTGDLPRGGTMNSSVACKKRSA